MFNPLALFAEFKTVLIVGALALTIGFSSGYVVKGKFVAAAQVSEMKKEVKVSANNIVVSNAISAKVEDKVEAITVTATKVKSAAAKRITNQQERTANEQFAQESFHQAEHATPAAVCPAFVFDVGTVRLLNAARQGTAVEPTGGSDEALNAASGIGISKLVDNDLDIVRMYHELALRHDALVDAVELKLKEQAQ